VKSFLFVGFLIVCLTWVWFDLKGRTILQNERKKESKEKHTFVGAKKQA